MLQQPLGEQNHENAFAGALGVPDDAALALLDALLGSLYTGELVLAWNFLAAVVEEDEVPDQVEQPRLLA